MIRTEGELGSCNGLNSPSHNPPTHPVLYVEILIPKVMVFGGEPLASK